MPELIRFIAARIRHVVANRRSAKRFEVRIRCTVGLAPARASKNGTRRDASLEGYTYDISATGLGLLMPAIHIDGRYLTGAGATLRILLELSDGPVLLQATAVRYESVEHEKAGMNYMIGVHIKEMNELDRERFDQFVQGLKHERTL